MAKATLLRRLRLGSRLFSFTTTALSIFALIVVWEVAVTYFDIPSYVMPTPGAVWRALIAGLNDDPTSKASFWYHLFATLQGTVFGFLIGSAIGVVLAALMAEFRPLQRVIFPYIVGFQSLPKVAIAPLYVIWFGYRWNQRSRCRRHWPYSRCC